MKRFPKEYYKWIIDQNNNSIQAFGYNNKGVVNKFYKEKEFDCGLKINIFINHIRSILTSPNYINRLNVFQKEL